MKLPIRRRVSLPRHRTTTAHLSSLYPFAAETGIGTDGVYFGTNLLTGGDGFWFDPFDAYRGGVVTNPNIVFAGEPGMGKSATAKVLIARTVTMLGRWVAIADPKGEYLPLAQALGLEVLKLQPGGLTRLNPLDVSESSDADDIARQRSVMAQALITTVLRRDLAPLEEAALGWAIAELPSSPTLIHLVSALAEPSKTMCKRAAIPKAELARAIEAVRYGLTKLLDGSLRGMFDGPSNVSVDWSKKGVVIDLSAVHHDADALSAVMVAATSWLQSVITRPDGPPRLQVLDEAWSLLASERTSRYLQACWKLGRSYGVANLAVIHRLSDLRSQADDGSSAAKVSMGLLADTQTRVLFRQASDQLADARSLLGLGVKETELLGRLCKGRAIWKVGGRTAVVQHQLSAAEVDFCDTDARMAVQ